MAKLRQNRQIGFTFFGTKLVYYETTSLSPSSWLHPLRHIGWNKRHMDVKCSPTLGHFHDFIYICK